VGIVRVLSQERYITGQGVPKEGEYVCQLGERMTLHTKEDFPMCPVSGKETTWKRENC
jgi:hypothetical protein